MEDSSMYKLESARFDWKLSFTCRKEFFYIISTRFTTSIIYRLCTQFRILQNVTRKSIRLTRNGNVIEAFFQLPLKFLRNLFLVFSLSLSQSFVYLLRSEGSGNCVVKKWLAVGNRTKSNVMILIYSSLCVCLCDLEWKRKIIRIKTISVSVEWNLMWSWAVLKSARQSFLLWNLVDLSVEKWMKKDGSY